MFNIRANNDVISVGSEEDGDLAAFLSIPYLLASVPTINLTPKPKVWKPSREDIANSFIKHVCTAHLVEEFVAQRVSTLAKYNLPFLPIIVAVGESLNLIIEYRLYVLPNVFYSFLNVCTAVENAYKIMWALNVSYSKDNESCWGVVQKCIFNFTSRYDRFPSGCKTLITELGKKRQ